MSQMNFDLLVLKPRFRFFGKWLVVIRDPGQPDRLLGRFKNKADARLAAAGLAHSITARLIDSGADVKVKVLP